MIRPVQKMVLLQPEKGLGVRVTHWRPERSPGVMDPANATAALPPAASDGVGRRPMGAGNTSDADGEKSSSGTDRSVTQRDRSCTGKTTEYGARLRVLTTGFRGPVI